MRGAQADMSDETPNPEEGGEQPAESFPPIQKRPKAKHKHAHHGGAWKVAYADFITTMMALFLVLWLVTVSDQSSKAMMSLYFRDPGIFDNPQGANAVPGSGAAVKTKAAPILEVSGSGGSGQKNVENSINMEQMARAIQRSAARSGSKRGIERQVTMKATRDGFQLQIADTPDVLAFEPGSAVLTREAQEMVVGLSEVIAAMANFSISLAGHTDRKPNDNMKYDNRELSADRAQRIMQMMVANGVPPTRFVDVAGYGGLYPVDEANPFAVENRRVVITLKNNRDGARGGRLPSLPKSADADAAAANGGATGAAAPAAAPEAASGAPVEAPPIEAPPIAAPPAAAPPVEAPPIAPEPAAH